MISNTLNGYGSCYVSLNPGRGPNRKLHIDASGATACRLVRVHILHRQAACSSKRVPGKPAVKGGRTCDHSMLIYTGNRWCNGSKRFCALVFLACIASTGTPIHHIDIDFACLQQRLTTMFVAIYAKLDELATSCACRRAVVPGTCTAKRSLLTPSTPVMPANTSLADLTATQAIAMLCARDTTAVLYAQALLDRYDSGGYECLNAFISLNRSQVRFDLFEMSWSTALQCATATYTVL